MGLFDTIFGKKTSEGNKTKKEEVKSNLNWIRLTSLDQLAQIKQQSKKEPIAVFKHSMRCGISRMVIRQFEESFTEEMKNLKVYYLDLLNYRQISDEIGYEFQVLHQSPQLLIIKNEKAIVHASHYGITQIPMDSFVK